MALESAKAKLMGMFAFENLPADRIAPAWAKIEEAFKLDLEELCALQNERCKQGSFIRNPVIREDRSFERLSHLRANVFGVQCKFKRCVNAKECKIGHIHKQYDDGSCFPLNPQLYTGKLPDDSSIPLPAWARKCMFLLTNFHVVEHFLDTLPGSKEFVGAEICLKQMATPPHPKRYFKYPVDAIFGRRDKMTTYGDLALLLVVRQPSMADNLPSAFNLGRDVSPGTSICVIGWTSCKMEPSLHHGIVASSNAAKDSIGQKGLGIDAPINGGFSGGPVLEIFGSVVGVATASFWGESEFYSDMISVACVKEFLTAVFTHKVPIAFTSVRMRKVGNQ